MPPEIFEYKTLEGDQSQIWKDRGFQSVFKFITVRKIRYFYIIRSYGRLNFFQKNLTVENHIKFGKEVTKIDWSEDLDKNVIMQCTDGSSFEAKHVIFTASLGVLKANHQTMFSPYLPPIKTNAIEAIQFGTVNKIMLEFKKPFWPANWSGWFKFLCQKNCLIVLLKIF